MNKLKSLIESGLVDREDGTIFDTRTNLLWQQVSPDKPYTWEEAINYCNSLTLAGYTNWRLPTIEELKTLINTRYVPTIDLIFECKSSWYWSSSTLNYPDSAWFVSFGDDGNGLGGIAMCSYLYVRPVCCNRVLKGAQP